MSGWEGANKKQVDLHFRIWEMMQELEVPDTPERWKV